MNLYNHVTEHKPIFFLSDQGPMLETLDYTIRVSVLAVHRPFYISICISTLPTQHTILDIIGDFDDFGHNMGFYK